MLEKTQHYCCKNFSDVILECNAAVSVTASHFTEAFHKFSITAVWEDEADGCLYTAM